MTSHKDMEKPDTLAEKSGRKHLDSRHLGLTQTLSNTTPVDRIWPSGSHGHPEIDDEGIGAVIGGETGEADRDVVPGGWAGTDDATSTAPSDLGEDSPAPQCDPDAITGRASAGGLWSDEGGVTDITGSPVEESRDWTVDALTEKS
jgi:hypothetical protein